VSFHLARAGTGCSFPFPCLTKCRGSRELLQKNGRARRQARGCRASAGRTGPVRTAGLLDRQRRLDTFHGGEAGSRLCQRQDDPLSVVPPPDSDVERVQLPRPAITEQSVASSLVRIARFLRRKSRKQPLAKYLWTAANRGREANFV
jgi:hypothetical protein